MPVRSGLASLKPLPGTNAGLWLDKYLARGTRPLDAIEKQAKADLVVEVCGLSTPDGYRQAFERSCAAESGDTLAANGRVRDRMIVGLGAKGVLEAGLRLDRTWGMPVIPASAIKGLAARTAADVLDDPAWKRTGADALELFGSTQGAGKVAFLDAWWVPDDRPPFHRDVITVHHADYYGASGRKGLTDLEDPTPVPFISVTGTYRFVVECRDAEWREAAMAILKIGLADLGIGAKTRSGYGRIDLDWESPAERRAADERRAAEERERIQAQLRGVLTRIATSNAKDLAPKELARFAAQPDLQRELARLILDRLEGEKKGWLRAKVADPKHRDWIVAIFSTADRTPPSA